jgi:subtilisin family serine protease
MHRVARIVAALILTLTMVLTATVGAAPAAAGSSQTYLVLYKGNTVNADAIKAAGGTLVYAYNQIGVAVARSDSASFAANVAKDSRVEGASATAGFATRIRADLAADSAPPINIPAPGSDNLSGLQWDMDQISAPAARAITGGSPSVIVGDLDTGLDYQHPDLAPNVDFATSVSCEGGVPNQAPAAWDDHNGHGTHTAGTIAAAKNGLGIVGVAPNVKIAGIKTSNDDGYFFPEAVVCAFMWAADHGIAVTNNSYFADPWLYNCRNDAGQRAIWKAEQRAIRYAMSKGVTVVASAGNENQDLAHPTIDVISPDFPPGSEEEREITNACLRIPAEIPGVVTVSANGNLLQKAYYSDYGVGVIDVVAPGGDRRFQLTPQAPNGRVLSTYPAEFFNPASPLMVQDCSVSPCAVYAYLQGTSMAGPHVAGVAALIVSKFGRSNPGAVAARIGNTADAIACPPNPFNPGPPFDFQAECQGGSGNNGFYGKGQVNALRAVSK